MKLHSLTQRRGFSSSQVYLLIIVIGLLGLFTLPYFLKVPQQQVSAPAVVTSVAPAVSAKDTIVVTRVIDGDTFVLENGEHVRLIGIDTPESRRNDKAKRDSARTSTDIETIIAMGQKSKEFLKGLVENKRVRLKFDVTQKDKYGRLLAYAYLEDGTFVNEAIIDSGYASPMTIPPNVQFADLFKASFQQAQAQKRGLWQDQAFGVNP